MSSSNGTDGVKAKGRENLHRLSIAALGVLLKEARAKIEDRDRDLMEAQKDAQAIESEMIIAMETAHEHVVSDPGSAETTIYQLSGPGGARRVDISKIPLAPVTRKPLDADAALLAPGEVWNRAPGASVLTPPGGLIIPATVPGPTFGAVDPLAHEVSK